MRRGGRGNMGGEWEVQTVGCKTGSRMYCTTWGIRPILCNNCKWKVTFKNCIKLKKNKIKIKEIAFTKRLLKNKIKQI